MRVPSSHLVSISCQRLLKTQRCRCSPGSREYELACRCTYPYISYLYVSALHFAIGNCDSFQACLKRPASTKAPEVIVTVTWGQTGMEYKQQMAPGIKTQLYAMSKGQNGKGNQDEPNKYLALMPHRTTGLPTNIHHEFEFTARISCCRHVCACVSIDVHSFHVFMSWKGVWGIPYFANRKWQAVLWSIYVYFTPKSLGIQKKTKSLGRVSKRTLPRCVNICGLELYLFENRNGQGVAVFPSAHVQTHKIQCVSICCFTNLKAVVAALVYPT